MKAKVCQTYGWSEKDMESLSIKKFYEYWLCIPALEAQATLGMIQASQYPHLKDKSARTKVFNKLMKVIKGTVKNPNDGKTATFGNLMKSISRISGNG